MSDSSTHYNIVITVTKVEMQKVPIDGVHGGRQAVKSERVVSEAGQVKIKNTNFDEAKRLAGAHLELLTEFTGTDPQRGNTRDI